MKKLPSATKTAILMTAVLILLFLLSVLFIVKNVWDKKNSSKLTAEIYQNGRLIHTIPLYDIGNSYEFPVYGENGSYNIVRICPGSIGIVSSSCPGKYCIHQGISSHLHVPVSCLPNHLLIRVVEEKDLHAIPDIDAITY